MNTQTPIWLEMKPGFIDENFESVLHYLENTAEKHDSFYQVTLDLLRLRTQMALAELCARPMQDDDCLVEEGTTAAADPTDTHWQTVRLLAAYLLSAPQKDPLAKSASAALLCELMHFVADKERLLCRLLTLLSRDAAEALPLKWADIREDADPMDLALRMSSAASTGNALPKGRISDDPGYVRIQGGNLYACSSTQEMRSVTLQSVDESLSACGRHFRIYAEKSRKLTKSGQQDMDKVDEWMEQTLSLLQHSKAARAFTYEKGQEMEVVVTAVEDRRVSVRSIDPAYEPLSGTLKLEDKGMLKIDYSSDVYASAFIPGDVLAVRLLDPEKGLFGLTASLDDRILSMVGGYGSHKKAEDMFAIALQAYQANDGKEKVRWLTQEGVVLHTYNEEGVQAGDYGYVNANYVNTNAIFGTIVDWITAPELAKQDAEEGTDNSLCPEDIKRNMVRSLVVRTDESLLRDNTGDSLLPEHLHIIQSALLNYQRTVNGVVERYIVLCIIRFLLAIHGSAADIGYITYLQGYLRNLVRFASGKKVVPVEPAEGAPLLIHRRYLITCILAQCGAESDEELQRLAEEADSSFVSNLCKLVQAFNNLDNVGQPGLIRMIRDVIIRSLSMQTEQAADLVARPTENLGQENSITEFKTSFCYDAQTMQPDEKKQGERIMRAICAFLNSDAGGTIYMGVNDLGDVVGLQADFKYYGIQTADSYIRLIQTAIARYFPEEYNCVSFPQRSFDASGYLTIRVEPYQSGVARLGDDAIERWGNQTRRMTETQVQALLRQRTQANKRDMGNLQKVLEARRVKRQVILGQYRSSSSRQADRCVEAFGLLPDNSGILAYELNAGVVKTFKFDRMNGVKITDTPWQYEHKHEWPKVDVFNMTANKTFPVCLELATRAYNLLKEEYPRSTEFITPVEGTDDRWIFSAEMCSPKGVGRFVIGLRSEITILDGDPLKEYIAQYVRDHLLPDAEPTAD